VLNASNTIVINRFCFSSAERMRDVTKYELRIKRAKRAKSSIVVRPNRRETDRIFLLSIRYKGDISKNFLKVRSARLHDMQTFRTWSNQTTYRVIELYIYWSSFRARPHFVATAACLGFRQNILLSRTSNCRTTTVAVFVFCTITKKINETIWYALANSVNVERRKIRNENRFASRGFFLIFFFF